MILNQIKFTTKKQIPGTDQIIDIPIMIDYAKMDTWEDGMIYYEDGREWEVVETARQITNAYHRKALAIEAQADELEAGGKVDEKPEDEGVDN
jgi:hypothetical protein